MFDNTPSDKMQVLGIADLRHPGTCMVCGNGTHPDGYVDLGVWYEYEGNCYICSLCLKQAAEVIGCLVPEEAKALQEAFSAMNDVLTTAELNLKVARERLAVYDDAIVRAARFNADDRDRVSSALASLESQQSALLDETTSQRASGEPTPEEPIKIKRRGDSKQSKLRDTTPGDDFLEL